MNELIRVADRVPAKSTPNTAVPQSVEASETSIESPTQVLEILRSKPSASTLRRVLIYLCHDNLKSNEFSIKFPSALSTQIISTLVNSTVLDYWSTIKDSIHTVQDKARLLRCLRSVSGIGAVLTKINSLIAELDQHTSNRSYTIHAIEELLAILADILSDDDCANQVWRDIVANVPNASQRKILWKEFTAQTASSKILATAAQAEDVIQTSKESSSDSWIAKGAAFAAWLGRNIAAMLAAVDVDDLLKWTAISELCSKSLSLGYSEYVVQAIYAATFSQQSNISRRLRHLITSLPAFQQLQVLESSLSVITKRYFTSHSEESGVSSRSTPPRVLGASALLSGLVSENDILTEGLVDWLTRLSGAGIGEHIDIRRAAFAALSTQGERLRSILDKSLRQFGDKLYIRHTPILHQQVATEVFLIVSGYVYRSSPQLLVSSVRSKIYLEGISNRLAASSPKARFLGMVTGMAISQLVDKPENRMKFNVEDGLEAETQRFMQLVYVNDDVGDYRDILKLILPEAASRSERSESREMSKVLTTTARSTEGNSGPTVPKVVLIDQLDDEDLIPYEKPDSDREDEEDDPTLVQRNPPIAPVYIRDLIAGLRDNENYDRHRLALITCATLIRRKANFGAEVTDHIEELATILLGMRDTFELEKFEEIRQQSMVALILAQPPQMGLRFSTAFFEGDYSLSQRIAALSALGLGARELAGFGREVDESTREADPSEESFPSRKLPEKLHRIYGADLSSVDAVAKRLERTMIEPVALEAADKLSGPNALKVRTFSSRMEVESKRKKPVANELAKIVADSFFFPLTGRWWRNMQAYGTDNVHFSPVLLPPFIKTLALLLHAAGPSALALAQMTSEFWDLLLSIRTTAGTDAAVLEAVLFALLTVLEVNENKERLVHEQAKELVETQEWAEFVFQRTEGRDEESSKVKMLAAALVLRCREIIERFQRLLSGDIAI